MSGKVKETLVNLKDQDSNVYEHIKKLVVKLAANREDIDSLQNYSFHLKSPQQQEIPFNIKESYSHMQQFQTKNRNLLGKINTGTAEQPQQPASLNYQPDFLEESQMFAKHGVGIGEDQAYRVFKSINRLSVKKNSKQIKFWGKILGKCKDYYVAEGLADGGEEAGELPPDAEPRGTGVNKMNYWVSTDLTDEWTELPLIFPHHIITARKIKYMFTGDLKKNILTNPKFNGTEAHLLKCQIVRINATCCIIPKGLYVRSEEDPKQITMPEQYVFPIVSNLANKENWVYFQNNVLKNGRVSLQKPEGLEGDDEKKWEEEMNQKDPTQPRLKSIVMDSEKWALKGVGVEDVCRSLGKQGKIYSKGVVGIKNLLWPGWLTIGYEGKYSSIYMGYGHKAKECYYPSEPETVLCEAEDRQEMVINE